MGLGEVAAGVPVYALWFGTLGPLAAVTGLLIGRDGSMKEASDRKYELGLARLNEHLTRVARLAHTIVVGEAVIYTTVRDRRDFEELARRVAEVRRSSLAFDAARLLTRAGVVGIVLHLVAGVAVTSLSLSGTVANQASDVAVFVPWLAFTIGVLAVAVGKGVLFMWSR
jgi:hypothetical protein